MFARFGSFTAPFVVNIGIEWVSITIFCVLAFVAGSLCYFLPETKDTVLLNTIEQIEKANPEDTKPAKCEPDSRTEVSILGL